MIKLLLVDDEKGICDILKDFFKIHGFNVYSAVNGKEALSLIKKQKPQIVILDVQMPDISGLEVLKEIKQIDKNIKVIMVTVLDDEGTKSTAKERGADDFITKPFTTDYLEKVVAKKIEELMKEKEQMEKPLILVVDDEEDVRERLGNIILRRIHCKVKKSASGEEALEELKKDKYDLVLLDIKMPGLSGIDVMREAVNFSPGTKFLAISGYDSKEIANGALEAGAIDFMHKPLTPAAIELKVKDILSKIGKYHPK